MAASPTEHFFSPPPGYVDGTGDFSPPPPDLFEVFFPPTDIGSLPPTSSDGSILSPPPPDFGDLNKPSPTSRIGVYIGIGVSVPIIIFIGIGIFIYIYSRRKEARRQASNGVGSTLIPPVTRHDIESVDPSDTSRRSNGSSHFGHRRYTYEQLIQATKNFSDTELLGKGGSGSVYKGWFPDDGSLVAVKRIPQNSNQGVKEFKAEVSIISNLGHRNLVKLKGWCLGEGNNLVVYDYMPNGSLDHFLKNDALCVNLNWQRRYSIATGLGSALLYLHEEYDNIIIHRDVKSSNVLLDESFVAKLGDFGLSRQVDLGATSHISSAIAGTWAYMAPECFSSSGRVTKAMDMYAFGTVLLEVVSGRQPLEASLRKYNGSLVDWVWDLFGQDKVLQAVDKRLGKEWDREEAKRMLVVGLACSHPDAQSRPKISRAQEALRGTGEVLYVPLSKPNMDRTAPSSRSSAPA